MIEIEFIPIGDNTNTGDAILCHFNEPVFGTERIILVDGGFKDTSDQIIAHVQKYYKASSIDLMVCTHPDDDHINGLFGVLEKMQVDELLIHRPMEFGYSSDDVKASRVEELIALANSRGTVVTTDAFEGHSYFSDAIRVAGPTQNYYSELLNDQKLSLALAHKAQIRNALTHRSSDPGEGQLTDNGGTTPRNNSSVLLDIQVDGYRVLLTGDAGAPALTRAAEYLERTGRGVAQFPDLFDVPHHGSRHNLTTELMNRLAGPIVSNIGVRSAFVSVGKEANDFPRAEVANAFTRRGYSVAATRGKTIRWSRDAGDREGWTTLTPLPWLEDER